MGAQGGLGGLGENRGSPLNLQACEITDSGRTTSFFLVVVPVRRRKVCQAVY